MVGNLNDVLVGELHGLVDGKPDGVSNDLPNRLFGMTN